MRDPRFLHLGLAYSPTLVPLEIDTTVSSEALDWIRYSFCSYVLWTTSDAETVVRKVMRQPSAHGLYVFCAEIVTDGSYGFLPEVMWEWIQSKDPKVAAFDPDPARSTSDMAQIQVRRLL